MIQRVRETKGILASVMAFVLLISACGRARNGAATPLATTSVAGRETQVESSKASSAPNHTPYPTHTQAVRLGSPQAPTDAPTPTATPTTEPTATTSATDTLRESASAMTPTAPPPPQEPAAATPVSQAPAGQAVELTRVPDTDPGPPLAILVSAVRMKENGFYEVTGRIRNDGEGVYGGVGVVATFFTEVTYSRRYVPDDGGERKGKNGEEEGGGSVRRVRDPDWHRTGKVYAACQLLPPGATCPFSLEIYPRDYVSYHLHPDASPVEYRQPVPLDLSNLRVRSDGVGHVRTTGIATNENPFAVRDANIAGTLIDAHGQIASVGWTIVPGEIAPGASVDFDLRIDHAHYARYELHAEATQN